MKDVGTLPALSAADYGKVGLTPEDAAEATVELSRPAIHAGKLVHALHFRELTLGQYARVVDRAAGSDGQPLAGQQVLTCIHLSTGLPMAQVEQLAGRDFARRSEAVGAIMGPTVDSGGEEV